MDKLKHKVIFHETGHRYTNEVGEEYISVTTLRDLYKKEYDSPYWSTYKAIKDVLEDKNEFEVYKVQAGGWKNVVQFWSQDSIYQDEVLDRVKYYIDLWDKQSEEGKKNGTFKHKQRENLIIQNKFVPGGSAHNRHKHLSVITSPLMDFNPNTEGVLAEVLVWSDKHMVAGQVDKVEKEGIWLDIKDYKTDKEITKEPFMYATMLHPISEVPDANFFHYQVQMSLYGYLLEQIGYKVRSLELIHITDQGDKVLPVQYMPGWIEKILTHYGRHKKHKSGTEPSNTCVYTK